eukprot:6598-Heterococcus_DN1.PRE.1
MSAQQPTCASTPSGVHSLLSSGLCRQYLKGVLTQAPLANTYAISGARQWQAVCSMRSCREAPRVLWSHTPSSATCKSSLA